MVGFKDSYKGAHILEYEPGKFMIAKEPKFQSLLQEMEGFGAYYAICELARRLCEELDARYGFQTRFNRGYNPQTKWYLEELFYETVGNAELYGNEYQHTKKTWIEHEFIDMVDRGILRLTVRDEGKGFDHEHIRSAEADARGTKETYNKYRKDPPKEGAAGRGLFMVIRYCDEVKWNEKGNEISVTKILRATPQ